MLLLQRKIVYNFKNWRIGDSDSDFVSLGLISLSIERNTKATRLTESITAKN